MIVQDFQLYNINDNSFFTFILCWYRFLGRGLFTIPDFETWKPRRQLYDPAFKKRSVYHCSQAAMQGCIWGGGHWDFLPPPPPPE